MTGNRCYFMHTLKNILTRIRGELQEKEKVREEAQKSMRQATSLSKQAILRIHQKRFKESERLIAEAREIISKLWETSRRFPAIVYTGMFSAALQEYSEANIFFKLVQESKFISPGQINVTSADYVLGLADVIGECRRFVLDELRVGNLKKAEDCLHTMDEIYIQLMAMDESYMLINGLRRKCDVARKIIEITRGDITQEIRRSELEQQLRRLEERIKLKRAPAKN
jgi:translin